AGGERRLAGPAEQLLERQRALAARTGHARARAEDDQRRHDVGRGRGVADVAADRALVADLDRADQVGAVDERRPALLDRVRPGDLAAGDHGADIELAVGFELRQLRDPA